MPNPEQAPLERTSHHGPILLIEDNRGDAILIEAMLQEAEGEHWELLHVDHLREALALSQRQSVDVILADLSLPDSSGLETVAVLQEQAPRTPIIVLTGSRDRELALQALQQGAQDYLVKDEVSAPGLSKAIHYAIERKQAELRLRESETRYKSLFHSVPDTILLLREGRIVDCNSRAAPLLGYSREELIGLTPATLSPSRQPGGDVSAEAFRDHVQAARAGEPRWFEWQFQRIDNRSVATEVILDRVLLNDQQHVFAIVRDLTERKQAEQRIRFQASLLNQVHNAVFATDTHGRIIYWNRYATTLYQWTPEEAMGKRVRDLVIAPDKDEVVDEIRSALELEQNWEGEVDLLRRDGSQFPALVTVSAIRDHNDNLSGFVGVASDITERKEVERKLAHSAFHDTLTGLPNRALFADRLARAIAKSSREGGHYSVLMMDLDRFKVINDSLGHLVGDELLIQFSRRVESCLRPGDTLARMGGDEFTVLLEDIQHNSDAIRVAERIHEKMSQPFLLGQNEIYTSTSIGITFGTINYREPAHALRDADIAMYRAKNQGKGCHIIFEQAMHERALSQLRRETQMRRALENGEFAVHYQPILDLETQRCIGAEALLRWPHQDEAAPTPQEFIAVAEESGLIVPVGQEVFDQACEQLSAWRHAGVPEDVALHVNLTTKQFCHRGLAAQVQESLERFELPGRVMVLEVNEAVLTEHPVLAAAVLADLRELGVRVCVEGFGTGAASLGYLQQFTIDALKIDRSFTRDVDSNKTTSAIVRALVSLGGDLDIHTICEGVEREEQLTALRSLGCRYAQGFLLQRPMRLEQMLAYLQADNG